MKSMYPTCLAFTLLLFSCKKELSYENGQTPPPAYHVSTLSGTGSSGYQDGAGNAALFTAPKGIAVDADGNIYIGDTGNNRVRKVSGTNIVTTLAGRGNAGFADGGAATALFSSPADIAVDGMGNIFIADMNNHRIRKVAPDGMVTTVAGSKTAGYSNGEGSTALFNIPRGIAVDAAGNIYVADKNNHAIRKIAADGTVSTVAGNGREGYQDGAGLTAQFSHPRGLAIDRQGNLFVADAGNNCIRKISASGVVSTVAGSKTAGYQDGNSPTARFRQPRGIAIDSKGVLYIGDTGNNRIRRIAVTGEVTTIAGNGGGGLVNGAGTAAEFSLPRALVVDKEDRYLYVADQQNHCIRTIALL